MARRLLVISNEPYHGRIGSTNRQRLARAATRAGWSVTYLETIGFGSRRREVADGVEVRHAMNLLPKAAQPSSVLARGVNHFVTGIPIRRTRWDVVVAYDPFSLTLVDQLKYDHLIYDCVDAYEYQPQYARLSAAGRVRKAEAALARRADIRVATSPALASRRQLDWELPVTLLHGAHELPSIDVHTRPNLGRRALYVGAFDGYKLDPSPVLDWLEEDGERSLVMAGKPLAGTGADLQQLLQHKRVHVRGPVSLSQFRSLARDADYGIVSLRSTPYNLYSFPLKTWDYMMNGLPVLASNANNLESISGVLPLASVEQTRRLPRSNDLVRIAATYHVDRRLERLEMLL